MLASTVAELRKELSGPRCAVARPAHAPGEPAAAEGCGDGAVGRRFAAEEDPAVLHDLHDDLLDAVEWAVDQKVADAGKVAISGGS